MDLTTFNPAPADASQQHVTMPLHGGGVATDGFSRDAEVFSLQDNGKFKRMKTESFLMMIAKRVIFSGLVLKIGDVYYCGGDSVWRKMESKGENRKWLMDYVMDNIKNFDEHPNWLYMTLKELFAI